MTVTICKIRDERQVDIPAHWLIMNAPRPLLGNIEWTGDFRHGIFYAAIDPADLIGWQAFKQNAELDGWLVEYTPQAEIDKWLDGEAARLKMDRSAIDPDHARDSFFLRFGRREEDAEECWKRLAQERA